MYRHGWTNECVGMGLDHLCAVGTGEEFRMHEANTGNWADPPPLPLHVSLFPHPFPSAPSLTSYAGWGHSLLNFTDVVDAVAHAGEGGAAAETQEMVIQIAVLVVCLCHFLVMFNPAAVRE